MKTKLHHRILALIMAGMMSLSMLPTSAFAEAATEMPPVVQQMTLAEEETTPETQQTEQQERHNEDEAVQDDEDPLPAVQEEIVESMSEQAEPEQETAAEKCVAYEHLSDPNGICTVCGTDLTAEFIALYYSVNEDEYIKAMNRWGWLEQNDMDSAQYAEAESAANTLFEIICEAADVFSCFEMEVEGGVSPELYAMVETLFRMDAAGRLAYQYPQDPAIFGIQQPDDPGEETAEDDILFADLPDAPTGSYMGSRGLPVATGETKISISAWTSDLYGNGAGRFDAAALNRDTNTVQVKKENGKTYAVVPIMLQVEYPANGSSSYVTLPAGVEVLRFGSEQTATEAERDAILCANYEEMSASMEGFFVKSTEDFTATFTYVNEHGDSMSKTLMVVVGDVSDTNLQRNVSVETAVTLADRPTPSVTSGVITKTQYVVDTWLIWFNGQEAYCCSHGLKGKVNGCPTYGYSHTSVLGADQYTGDHYTTQVSVWGGLGQLSLGLLTEQHSGSFAESQFRPIAATYGLADEALLQYCYRIYDDRQMHIITRYPESEAAKIYLASAQAAMSGAEVLASATGYYTYIYTPPISGWQTIAVIGPSCDEEGEEQSQEYYADWSAGPETASGSFDFTYNITADKHQLETGEKVDDAVIDVEPVTKSGTIDGGSWAISPSTKQTLTTKGHTMDDNFQNNGGTDTASWSLHYDVTKTSGTKSGTVGPYSSQSEADSAAESARSSAAAELKAQAQAMVNSAIASAKSTLNTLDFTYNETTVPYGFLAYGGNYGSRQNISVEHDTDKTYPMKNDEWSLKVRIQKLDSETRQQIAADAAFEVFEWDVVSQQYIPFGGYNQYKVERQPDGTYKVVNHSAYAATAEMQETLYYTQRNEGKFVIVETTAPEGYYGDWSNASRPGVAGTPLGKRGYYIELTKARDGSTIWLDNLDYNADVAAKYTTGTKLLTADGTVTTVVISDYKNAAKTYNTDNSKTAANEDSYTMTPVDGVFFNDRVLGEISISKVDLDAVRYVDGRTADGSAMKSGESHGDSVLDGAVYDLYAAKDITHPDGHSGVVDYSKIVDAEGNPIWHTTIRDDSGNWVSDYLPVLCKDHLVASAEIKDGWLTFSNLYLGEYYIIERSTGTTIPVEDGAFVLSGSYPQVDKTLKPTGGLSALKKDGSGHYTEYPYKNQFSSVSEVRSLDGSKAYYGYYSSYAKGYLCDTSVHLITPAYNGEGWYVEKVTFEDDRQAEGEQRDKTLYSANVHLHKDNALAESQQQVMKSNVEISKVVSSSGQSNGIPLEHAGFTFYLISDLSKATQFEMTDSGNYKLDSILNAYVNLTYDQNHMKYDFAAEAAAIAKTYEVDATEIATHNRTLTAEGDYRNGRGEGWVPTGAVNEYQLQEIYSNDNGTIRVEGLPYGQYLVVETTVPRDVQQAEPFIVNITAADSTVPLSRMAAKETVPVSYMKYTVLDEEMEVYLNIVKLDEETGKPVLRAGTAYQLYWLDDEGNVRLENGAPKRVVMTDTHSGTVGKTVDTFYSNENGIVTLPEMLPLGHYRIVEIQGPEGFYNEWADTTGYFVDFAVTTERIYNATGNDEENGYDTLVITEQYVNHETLGKLTIRKSGEALTGWAEKDADALDLPFSGMAAPGDFTYEERNQAGAVYEITADEDIFTQDNQKDAEGNRTLWYAKGDVVATVTTGSGESDEVKYAPGRTPATYDFLSVIHNGIAGEVSVTLPLGKYHVAEIQPPYGFIGTSASYDVTFRWDDQKQDVVMACEIIATPESGKPVVSTFEIVRADQADEAFAEQQVLKFHNEREKAKAGVYKIDQRTGKYLAGAVFNLYTVDDIYDADGKLIFAADDLVATSPATIETGYTYFDVDIPIRGEKYGQSEEKNAATNSGNYYVREIVAPAGYYLNDEPMEVSFTYNGEALMVLDNTCANEPTCISVSKQDLTNGKELPGATLTITDAEGKVVEQWVSGDKPTIIYGLHLGEEYTLTEVQPAIGYAFAESIRFRLIQRADDTGKLLNEANVYIYMGKEFFFWDKWVKLDDSMITMKDDTIKVNISKVDIVSGEELPGAEIIIRDAEGNEIDRWISEEKPHFIERMPAGEYTLEEITAPNGYAVSEKVSFTVLPTGEIQSVAMKDAPYFGVDKVKLGGELLPGAKLSVLDSSGNVVDSWVTDSNSHKVIVTNSDDTLPGAVQLSDFWHERVYTLHEDAAPAGYDLASSIQFKVERDKENILAVYVRDSAHGAWTLVDGKTVTMVDKQKPAPDPGPEPNPEPTPVPTPVPTSTPVVTTVPQTGDSASLPLMLTLLGVSLGGIGLISVYLFNRKKETLPAVIEEVEDEQE